MTSKEKSVEWLQRQTKEYHLGKNGMGNLVEELECKGKLG
jgi:hypothetical protein